MRTATRSAVIGLHPCQPALTLDGDDRSGERVRRVGPSWRSGRRRPPSWFRRATNTNSRPGRSGASRTPSTVKPWAIRSASTSSRSAEAQRRVRRQRAPVSREHERPAKLTSRLSGSVRSMSRDVDPVVDRADPVDVRAQVRLVAVPLAPTLEGGVAGLEHQVTAGPQRLVNRAQGCFPVRAAGDRLGDVPGHDGEIDLHRWQGCRVAVHPEHPVGARLGARDREGSGRRVQTDHLDVRGRQAPARRCPSRSRCRGQLRAPSSSTMPTYASRSLRSGWSAS